MCTNRLLQVLDPVSIGSEDRPIEFLCEGQRAPLPLERRDHLLEPQFGVARHSRTPSNPFQRLAGYHARATTQFFLTNNPELTTRSRRDFGS